MKKRLLTMALGLSMSATFAKGGNNQWIGDLDLQQILKAYKQIEVVIEVEDNLNSFVDSTQDFTFFLGGLEERLIQNFLVKKSVNYYSFCLEAKNSEVKKSLVNKVKNELSFYPKSVKINIYKNSMKPCK